MSDEQALLATVIQNPEEDAPRLVLADWWEEHGQEDRADFCRVQVEIASRVQCDCRNLSVCIACRSVEALRRRERELLERPKFGDYGAANWCGWSDPVSSLIVARQGTLAGQPFEFRRGFVEQVTCSWSDWLTHADAIRAACPLRRVTLADRPPIPEQDGTRIWWQPFPPLDKFSLGKLGDETTLMALMGYWPGIDFTLPRINLDVGNQPLGTVRIWTGAAGDGDTSNPANWREPRGASAGLQLNL